MIKKYYDYIHYLYHSWIELDKLIKLNELNNYDINQLNIFINACEDNIYIFAANCGNIKIFRITRYKYPF